MVAVSKPLNNMRVIYQAPPHAPPDYKPCVVASCKSGEYGYRLDMECMTPDPEYVDCSKCYQYVFKGYELEAWGYRAGDRMIVKMGTDGSFHTAAFMVTDYELVKTTVWTNIKRRFGF